MTRLAQVSAAGFVATAITFGPGRMGFGLFLSEFKADFAFSSGTAGLISGLGFFGFFLGLLAAYALTAKSGPRAPVTLGLLAAASGAGTVAAAPGLEVLAAGVFLLMSSAGFSWAPYNNAVHRELPDDARPLALSIVSTGTSVGVAAAGATSLLLGLSGPSWRIAWVAFAVAAAVAALVNFVALRDVAGSPGPRTDERWRELFAAAARPLHAIAFSFGTTTAIYISFAADRIEQAGGLPGLPGSASSPVVFMAYGVLGLAGLATGRVRRATGLTWLLRILLGVSVLSHALVALSPTSWPGVILSAGLQGVFVMMISAILAFWSERLFPRMPSLGFTAALLWVAAGSVLGPVAAGYLSDSWGAGTVFIGTAALSAGTAVAILPHHVRERAANT
jgi:predicted MFS family arabinose efflux permease